MMKRPILRKAAVTEETLGVVIDPERDCNRKHRHQGVLNVMGLTIAAMMLGALAVFTGSDAMAQNTLATAPTVVAGAIAPVLKIDTRDHAWVLTSTALVLSMHVLGTIRQSIAMLCLISLIWILVRYSLAFSADKGGLIGGREWVDLGRLLGASSGAPGKKGQG